MSSIRAGTSSGAVASGGVRRSTEAQRSEKAAPSCSVSPKAARIVPSSPSSSGALPLNTTGLVPPKVRPASPSMRISGR